MSVVDFEPFKYHAYPSSPESALQDPSDSMSSFDQLGIVSLFHGENVTWKMGSWYENCEPCMIMNVSRCE